MPILIRKQKKAEMHNHSLTRFAGFLGLFLAIILVAGCETSLEQLGRKQPEKAPPEIRDLQAQVAANKVELSWILPQPGRDMTGARYSIMRSQIRWEDRNCTECPSPAQHEAGTIDSAAAETAAGPERRFTWTDDRIAVYSAYKYQVTIHDKNGHPLSMSNFAVAKIYPPPLPPGNLSAATQPNGIMLQWKPATKDVQGHAVQGDLMFRIERLAQNKNWEKATSVPVKGNSFLDQTAAPGQLYTYRVMPVLYVDNTSIIGEPSSIAQAKAPETALPPPPNSVWITPGKGGVEVRWNKSDGKVGGYHVYRKEGKEIIRLTSNPVQDPPFVDNSIKGNIIYSYAVSAVSVDPQPKEGLLSKWSQTGKPAGK